MRVSVILPTYNEAENLKILIPTLDKIFKENKIEYEILVVDDNSPDKTWKVAEELSKKYPVRVIRRPKKLGLATAILEGILNSKYEICLVMDADLQHSPEDVIKLLKEIEKGYDLVIGSRYVKGGRIEGLKGRRKLDSLIATYLAKFLFNLNVEDPLSGLFAIRKEKIINETKWYAIGYKILLEILVRFKDLKVKEVPIIFRKRKYGKSKLNCREVINYLILLLYLLPYSTFFKFCLCGLIGVIFSEIFLYFLVEILKLNEYLSGVINLLASIFVVFILNYHFTFREQKEEFFKKLIKFYIARIFSGIIYFLIYSSLVFVGINYLISNLIAIFIAFVINYLTSIGWVWST